MGNFSDRIAATGGAIIGTIICPGAWTIIGGLVGGIASMIINAALHKNSGGFSFGYSSNGGFYPGHCNEKTLKKIKKFFA